MSLLLAHRDILVLRGNQVAFGEKRTSYGWQRGLAGSQMTETRYVGCRATKMRAFDIQRDRRDRG
jgi:hypothetical protein